MRRDCGLRHVVRTPPADGRLQTPGAQWPGPPRDGGRIFDDDVSLFIVSLTSNAMTPERTAHSAQFAPLADRLAGALAVAVGGVALSGWALDIAALKSVLPGWVSMKPNTAVAFILAGFALLLASRERAEVRSQWSSAFGSRICALRLAASSALRGVSICGTDPAQRRLGCDK